MKKKRRWLFLHHRDELEQYTCATRQWSWGKRVVSKFRRALSMMILLRAWYGGKIVAEIRVIWHLVRGWELYVWLPISTLLLLTRSTYIFFHLLISNFFGILSVPSLCPLFYYFGVPFYFYQYRLFLPLFIVIYFQHRFMPPSFLVPPDSSWFLLIPSILTSNGSELIFNISKNLSSFLCVLSLLALENSTEPRRKHGEGLPRMGG